MNIKQIKIIAIFTFVCLQTVLTGRIGAQTAPGGTNYIVELWLKADHVQNTLPADNADVSIWKDRSGKGLDFVQKNSDAVPQFKRVSEFNFQPSLVWSANNGSNRALTLRSQSNFTPSTNKAYYIFTVSTPYSTTREYAQPVIQLQPNNNYNTFQTGGTAVSWTGINTGTANTYNTYRAVTASFNGNLHATGTSSAGFNTQTDDKKFGIISWIIPNNGNSSSGDIAAIYLNGHKSSFWDGSGSTNGLQDRRGRGSTWQISGGYQIQLGQGGGTTGSFCPFGGEIMEVIILSCDGNQAIDEDKLHRIETYLALKYGLTLNLSSTDAGKFDKYVNSANQAVWTYDADFNQKIFGIGRDDASGLYQKQSKSYEGSAFTAFVGNNVADLNINNNATLNNMDYVVFGAATPGSTVEYGGVNGYPSGTLFDGVALNAPKGINYRKNEIYKAIPTKNGVVKAMKVQLKMPITTQYVLVSKNIDFNPVDTRFYEVKNGMVAIEVDANFKYIDFAGYRATANSGPGGVNRNIRLWLRADQITTLNLVSQTNAGGSTGQPDIAQYEKDGLLRESSVDSWTSIVPGAGANGTYFPKYEYIGSQSYSNRPGWNVCVPDLNYNPGVTFHRRTENINSNSVAAEYLVKNANTDATKIFDQKVPDRVTLITAMIPEINPTNDVTWIFGFGTGNTPDYGSSHLVDPQFGVNAQSSGIRSFRYAEYGMGHVDQDANGDGVVGVENMFEPHSTFIMSYYMHYNYNTPGDDTLKFGVNGKYEISHSGRNDNYNKARGNRATFDKYASIGASGVRGRALKGNVGEVIFFEGQLTKDETEKVNSYLAIKYGITLKVADYGDKFDYKLSDGASIWSGYNNGVPSVESLYHNNVAAVVRDGQGDLYIRQSHSTELNSMLHVGIAGSYLSKDGKSNLGDFDHDKEAMVWGHNGETGFRNVPQNACYKFARMFKRTWLMKKTTVGNQAVPLMVAIQDNRAASSSQAMLDMYDVLIPQNEFFMIVADSPADIAANNFKAAVPMKYLNGEFQCLYNFTDEFTYVTFAYNQNAYPCVNHTDKEFDGVKTFDWTQWTRKNNNLNGSGAKTLTQPAKDLGDGITAVTTIKYDDQVRANSNYPRLVTTPRGGIEIERIRGVVNSSKVTVSIEFNNPVYLDFFVSGLDERYGQKDQVTITGKCTSDADDIYPVLSHGNARTTRFTINGKKAIVNRNGWVGASNAGGKLNVVFDKPVKKVVIEYVITGRIYGSAVQRIFISPLSLRSPKVPVPAPVINEDGLALTKEVKEKKMTACEEVEYSFYITNTNFTKKYVNFRDILPTGLTWKDESVGLDIINAKNMFDNRYLKIGNYAGTNTLLLDSLEIPCTSTIRITATALPANNLLQPGENRDFSNRAQLEYDRLLNNGQNSIHCILKSSDRETLEDQTVVNIEYTQARSELILGAPVFNPTSYGADSEIVVTLSVDNPNNEDVNGVYLDLNFDAGFTFKTSAGIMVSNLNGSTGAVVMTPGDDADPQRTIAGASDGSIGFILPKGVTTFTFTLVAPHQADLVHQLDANGQISYKVAPLNVSYTYSSADMGDACIAKLMNDVWGEFEVPYFSAGLKKVEPSIGPNIGGVYTGNSATGNPHGINKNGLVTIKGNGFKSGVLVDIEFGGIKGANVTVVNDSVITCIPPAVTSSTVWGSSHDATWNEGQVDVLMFLDNARIDPPLFDGYTYRAPMTITGISPDQAPVDGGTQVTIMGHNFLPPSLYNTGIPMPFNALFGSNPVDVVSVSNDRVVVTTKTHPVNYVNVTTDNFIEKYITTNKPFAFYPRVFIKPGNWDEYSKWEGYVSDNILPPPLASVHIKANCEQNMDVNMDSITVYPGVSYTVGSGRTLQSNVFTLLDDASFLNKGTDHISCSRVMHKLEKGRNWYVSSPVQGGSSKPNVEQSLGKDTQGNTLSSWRVEYYNEPDFNVWHTAAGLFETGRGYTAYSANEDIAACFTGRFTDGDQIAPVLSRTGNTHPKRGFNLVGNPFPSYWQWTSAAASSANVYSTIWYRTKNNEYEFWVYNATGNISAAPGWEDEILNVSLAYIPPLQAFWVRLQEGQTSGALRFSNSSRSHINSKKNVLKSTGDGDKRPLLRLAVTGDIHVDETVIYADPGADYGLDAYDSDKMFTGVGAEIFTLPLTSLGKIDSNEDNKLVINGLPVVEVGMEIPVGFQADQSGIFTFRAKEIQNFDGLEVFLRDRLRRVDFNLRNGGEYEFSAGSMPVTNRFSIVFSCFSATQAVRVESGNSIQAYTDKAGRIIVLLRGQNGQGDRIDVSVFDVTGRKLSEQPVAVNEKTVLQGVFKNGVYVLRAGKQIAKVVVNNKK